MGKIMINDVFFLFHTERFWPPGSLQASLVDCSRRTGDGVVPFHGPQLTSPKIIHWIGLREHL